MAWCLDRLVRQRERNSGSSATLDPCPKHHELAQMTGCSRETVSRALEDAEAQELHDSRARRRHPGARRDRTLHEAP